MIEKFISYWTELNRSKTKMRFELEKTFEISKRLATWSARDNQYPGKKYDDPKVSTKYIDKYNEHRKPLIPGK